jgi:uncharacterized damage-inducible protein DinB
MDSYSSLIDSYKNGAASLRAALNELSKEQLRIRTGPGKWSMHEVVCHIADSEVIYAERIRRVLAEDEPTLFNLEPDDFERSLVYEQRDPVEELDVIEAIRNQTARILRSLPPAAWQRRGVHSTDGPLTLRQLVERVTQHIPHHIEFIHGKRATLKA